MASQKQGRQTIYVLMALSRWIRGYHSVLATRGASPDVADSEFVVLGLDSALTAERVITGQAGVIELTDNGPNATLVIDVADRGIDFTRLRAIDTARLLGRTTAASGDVEQLTVSTGLSLAAGALGLALNIIDEGTPLGTVHTLKFVGGAVTASVLAGVATVTVGGGPPGGGGGAFFPAGW